MSIKRIFIENFRSIKQINFEPTSLNALIGRNNVGKSNILSALEIVLGDKWPPFVITENDLFNKDTSLKCTIEVYFDPPLSHSYYGHSLHIDGFKLTYEDAFGANISCIDFAGHDVQTQYGKPLPLNNAIRNKVPLVLVGVSRNLTPQLSASKWTVLGKLLKDLSDDFAANIEKTREYNEKIKAATIVLKDDNFKKFEEILIHNVKDLTGFEDASIQFKEPNILGHYKNLELLLKESSEYDYYSAIEMGAGIQNAIVIAIINAYKVIKKTNAILLIEEPEVCLHPHARRYFYTLIRNLSNEGTQVFYTTHSCEFVDLDNYESVNIIRKSPQKGTYLCQGKNISIDHTSREQLKLTTEFDSRRNEIFFANKVMVVEGETEKYSVPHLFVLKSIDVNKDNISIISAGSVTNIKFFVKILSSFEIPLVVLMDKHTNKSDYTAHYIPLNHEIELLAGQENVFMMDPEFESVFSLPPGGDKIRKAVEKVKHMNITEIPQIVKNAIERIDQIS
jgi:predicted ATP-dependent endonuclease of OLD family